MIKSLLIIFLSGALAAAAFITRPGKRELMLYLLDNQGTSATPSQSDFDFAERAARDATFKDRILWTDVERDGKVIYTGLFSHWISRTDSAKSEKQLPAPADLAKLFSIGK